MVAVGFTDRHKSRSATLNGFAHLSDHAISAGMDTVLRTPYTQRHSIGRRLL